MEVRVIRFNCLPTMSTYHRCQLTSCTTSSNKTYFPPSPPPSPPQHIHKQLPIRSYIPSEDQIIDAIGTAKLAMGRNQGSLAKVWGWIREREPTWAITERRLRKITQATQSCPPSPTPQAALSTEAHCLRNTERCNSYGQQATPRRPSHKCRATRKRKASPTPTAELSVLIKSPGEDMCPDHSACGPKCGVWRARMLDKRLDALDCELRNVRIRVRISSALMAKARLAADANIDVPLHVFKDYITGSEYILAPEFVRSYLPKVCKAGGILMHSLYTFNHAYGRGTPLVQSSRSDWRAWAGCPQALAKKPSSVSSEVDTERARERIWLLKGEAEVLIGPECEPDEETIDPPIVSSKGKNKAKA